MQEVVNTVRALEGLISEPVRSLVAVRLADMIGKSIPTHVQANWKAVGRLRFLVKCGVKADPAYAKDCIMLESTALANYCAKWHSVTEYKDVLTGKSKPFTQEMDALRVAMLEELVEVSN